MKKWENEFQNYDENEMTIRITELETKIANRTASRDDINELDKQKRIKENVGKVANILELRTKLENEKSELEQQIKEINFISFTNNKIVDKNNEKNNEIEKLTSELDKITNEIMDITNKLKIKDLSEKDRIDLNEKLQKLYLNRDENNNKFKEYNDKYNDNISKYNEVLLKYNGKYENSSKEDMQKRVLELSSQISKCNMAANNLMKGLNWDAIEVKFEKWQDKKFTSNKKITDKVTEKTKRTEKKSENETINNQENVDKIIKETNNDIEKEVNRIIAEEETSLISKRSFAEKHPRLDKIFGFFRNIKDKWNNKFNKQEAKTNRETIIENNENKENSEVIKDEEQEKEQNEESLNKNENDEFVKYLKEVAEKGMKQADSDKKAEQVKDAKTKFEENKRKAYERETEKFGKEYAEKSYNKEDEDERGDI